MKKTPQDAGSESGGRAGDSPSLTGVSRDGPESSAVPAPRTGSFDWWRENIEALLVAVILALIIRYFAVEAFEIPTGSMANTLFGLHACVECPNCSTEINVALLSDSSSGKVNLPYRELLLYKGKCVNPACTLAVHFRSRSGPFRAPGDEIQCMSCRTVFRGDPVGYVRGRGVTRPARCPTCHHVHEAVFESGNVIGGHKILVNKFSYALGEPRRFDVIVFGFDQWKNYIKRLIGLPGERINVWDGDVYVNGQVVRKSDYAHAQDVLWTKIGDTDVTERGLNPIAAWAELAPEKAGRQLSQEKNAQWNPTVNRWSMNATGDLAILEYQRRFDNYYDYNIYYHGSDGYPTFQGPDDKRLPYQVGDKMVSFSVKVASASARQGQVSGGGSWVGAEIRDGDFTFQLRIPVGKASETNLAMIEQIKPVAAGSPGSRASVMASIPLGTETRVEFENADDRVLARLNGQEILRIDYRSLPEGANFLDPPVPPAEMWDAQHLRIMASGVQAEFGSIQVFRDMFYIPRRHNEQPWRGITLGEGEYFAMGDNAPSSSDGRYWGSIPEKNLMGKALLVFWPAWPTNFQVKFIR